MNKVKYFVLGGLVLGSVTAFAAKDSTFHFQNSVRVGYDDNVYLATEGNQQETTFVSDIVNISGKVVFSTRSDLILFWQPEFRYRFDADPKFISYQDFYAKFSHAVSQRVFVQLSDRFRYQQKDGQSDLGATENQNFFENDLMGSLDFTLSSLSQIKVGAGYEFRKWDEDTYGAGIKNNDFDQFKANGSYIRELHPNTTYASAGLNYISHEYNGSRGGFDSATFYGGLDHNFNPNMLGTAQLGYSISSVDGVGGSQDTSSPFLQAGLDYSPTDRTSFNGSVGYSLSHSENSYYNASDKFNMGVGVRHDLTGKINLASTISVVRSFYDASYRSDYLSGPAVDASETYLAFSLRGSYQINRNNFFDAGYEFSQRNPDQSGISEYTRNRFDFGWRIRL